MKYNIDNGMPAHPQWKKHIERWRYLSDSYQGGLAYKDGEYLQRYNLETGQQYEQRIDSTPLDNLCKNIVHTYTSFIYSQPIKRDISGLNEETVGKFLKDCDLEGRSFDSFMRDVSIYSSVYGAVWIVVDKPSTPVVTLADQQAKNIRPYVAMYSPENVLDWKYERQENGVYQLAQLTLLEEVHNDFALVKVFNRDVVELRKVEPETGVSDTIQVYQNALGVVPAFVAYTSRSPIRTIGISDIDDIADQQRAIYSEYSEIEQQIRLSGHPSIVATPGTELSAGAGAVITIDDNLDPQMKPYLLQADGSGITSILDSIKNKVSAVERMAHLETARGTRTAMSGVAMLVESRILSQKLNEKAHNLCHAEEQLWGLFGMWEGTEWTGDVIYPDTFDTRDQTVTLQNIKLAKESGITNPKLITAMDNIIADVLIEDDEERAKVLEEEMEHPTTTPADRSQHIQEMIMEGFTDERMLALHPEITQEDIQTARQLLVDQDN